MAKIYESFEELMEMNKSVFKVLQKRGKEGIYRAIWDSRNPEIERAERNSLEKDEMISLLSEQVKKEQGKWEIKLEARESELKKMKEAEESSQYVIEGLNQKLNLAKEEVKELCLKNRDVGKLKVKLGEAHEEIKVLKKELNKSHLDEAKLVKVVKEVKIDNAQLLQQKKYLEGKLETLRSEFKLEQEKMNDYAEIVNNLKKELRKSNHRARKIRDINQGIEKELHKIEVRDI